MINEDGIPSDENGCLRGSRRAQIELCRGDMITNVEWESQNMEVLKALKAGTSALNKMHDEMSVEDVANLLDETREAIAVENEISRLLAGEFNSAEEAELEEELALLCGEAVSAAKESVHTAAKEREDPIIKDYPLVPTSPILPNAPTHEVMVETDSNTAGNSNSAK